MINNETNSEKLRELCDLMSAQGMKVFTHAGSMHRDEIEGVAAATLATGNPDSVSIVRLNDKELAEKGLTDSNALILDIGKGRFDHHFRDEPEKKQFYEDCFWTDEDDDAHPIEKSAVARLWDFAGPEIVYNTILLYLKCDPDSKICHKVARIIEEERISKISDTDTRGQKASPNALSAKITKRSTACEIIFDANYVDDEDEKEFAKKICMDALFAHLVIDAREDLIAKIVTEYSAEKQVLTCRKLCLDALNLGHPNWVNLTENYIGPYIPAVAFKDSGTIVRYTIVKSNRCKGEWNLQTADMKEAPLDGVESMPGFLKRPIPTLAIFDNSKSAEMAAAQLSKDLDIW